MAKLWEFAQPPGAVSGSPADILDFLLKRRGIQDSGEREHFLTPKLRFLADPLRIPGMAKAVQRVESALERKQPILIYSDYDVDGMTSSAVLYRFLCALGNTPEVFMPERLSEGYGLTEAGLKRALAGRRPDLVIALDCGTTSWKEVQFLKDQGIDTIIIDHHELPSQLPQAVALVNPQRAETDRVLATVGLTFKFCHALLKLRGQPELFDLKNILDLVAMGTIADLVPLEDDNRILVSNGLRQMAQTRHVGLQELMRVAGLRKDPQPETIGYVLGPRLNASGRLAEARAGWELLATNDLSRARQIAQDLDELNKQRQNLEREATDQAFAGLPEHFDPASHGCIVASSSLWHQGVIGIVAAKLLREYYCPTIVISIDEHGKGKGSARSIEGCSIMDALRDCRDHLLAFGGHAQAAGLEIEAARIPAFRQALNVWMRENISSETYQERLKIDLVMDEHFLTEALAIEIARMQPFGRSNPPPLLAVHHLSINGTPKIFGKNHIRFRAACGRLQFDAVAFNLADQLPPSPTFSIAGYWEMDLFTGRPCFRIVDWRAPS